MPYILVALVYIIAGGTVDEPLRFTNKNHFASLEACQSYLTTDKFQQERAALYQLISLNIQQNGVDTEEDAPIALPGIAITVSCEEDKTL